MEEYISRSIEKNLSLLLKEYPAVGLIGPRQAGKTTLVKSLVNRLRKKSLYLDLESHRDLGKLKDPTEFLAAYPDHCIILDEIQRMPELFPLLRSLIDEKRKPGRFIILGSASPVLIKKSSESLAGRIAYLKLHPFILPEILNVCKREDHWLKGGFPKSLFAASDESGFRWRMNFIQTFIERDLPVLGLNAEHQNLHGFISMLAHASGQIWNAETYARSVGVTAPTVKRYLYYFENTYLATILRPFFVNVKKRLVKAPKAYVSDSGILHALLNLQTLDELRNNVIIGNSWEGYAVAQIKALLPEFCEMYYYRTHQGAEADIIITKGGKPRASVEIKYGVAPGYPKGFRQVISDLKTSKNFIIYSGTERYPVDKETEVLSLEAFLKDVLPKI